MAYTENPTGVFGTGVSTNGTGITIPYSALESYSSSTSGDVREFLYSVLEKTADAYLSLPTTGVNGRWAKLTVNRSTSVISDETLRKTYTIGVDLNIQNLDVVDEAWTLFQ